MSEDLPALERYVAFDCETIQLKGRKVLAKIGMVDHAGTVILDSYVYQHPLNVVDWLTRITGIKEGDLDGAPTFEQIQPKIIDLLKGKIVVGHALWNDLEIIKHPIPYKDMRDTALYYSLRKVLDVSNEGAQPGLKKLAKAILDRDVQTDIHCPVEDARTTMALFMTVREEYERALLNGEDCIAGLPESYAKWYR